MPVPTIVNFYRGRLLLHPHTWRNRHFLLLDILVLSVTPTAALILRLDGIASLPRFVTGLVAYTLFALVVRLAIFYFFGLYRRLWRYASVDELAQIAFAASVSLFCIAFIFFGLRLPFLSVFREPSSTAYPLFSITALPRSTPLIDGLLALAFVGATRFSLRLGQRWRRRRTNVNARAVLVMGAGDAGTMIVRELQNNPHRGMDPIGYLDDDPAKYGVQIHGIPVLGTRQDIPRMVAKYNVEQIIIAMPAAAGKTIREIISICERAGVQTKIIPSIHELLDGTVSINQLRNVDIEDLLRREPVQTDIAAVRELIRGKRVLITGGGGSIGSELCRQALRCGPAALIIVGHGENSLFEIGNELHLMTGRAVGKNTGGPGLKGAEQQSNKSAKGSPEPPAIHTVIADTRFPERMRSVFEEYRPEIVFHAAAHKHVSLMELNPSEAITNNIVGTRHLLDVALATGVQRFVMISTDKAVNPTSIMGASKRVAELLVLRAASQSGRSFVTVRFGNVLGSRGSVILTFKKQIAAGGPVTVTDPEVERYFMTIPEAVQLVLQATVLGQGGEVFVLDMGEPVKIADLAHDLIELSGLQVGRDIDIVFTGIFPGEKLFEELFVAGEQPERTRHEKIFIASNGGNFVPDDLDSAIARLEEAALQDDRAAIVRCLEEIVPEYRPGGEIEFARNGGNAGQTSKEVAAPAKPFVVDSGQWVVDSG